MKSIVILAFFVACSTLSFAQSAPRGSKHDPSYSVRNYKHENKAAIAKELNLDKTVTLENITATDRSNYKHQAGSTRRTRKATIAPYEGTNYPAKSNKHPLG